MENTRGVEYEDLVMFALSNNHISFFNTSQ